MPTYQLVNPLLGGNISSSFNIKSYNLFLSSKL